MEEEKHNDRLPLTGKKKHLTILLYITIIIILLSYHFVKGVAGDGPKCWLQEQQELKNNSLFVIM